MKKYDLFDIERSHNPTGWWVVTKDSRERVGFAEHIAFVSDEIERILAFEKVVLGVNYDEL